MVQPCHVALLGLQGGCLGYRPVLEDTLTALAGIELYTTAYADPPKGIEWLDRAALASPDSEPLAAVLQRFKSSGFAFNRRAASASLLLRYGWAAGFAIAAYLTRARVPVMRDFALFFSSSAILKGLWVRDAQFIGLPEDAMAGGPEWGETVTPELLRQRLLETLVAFTEPVVAGHHAWSRFSRHALWAMATSSWASQFANVARQLGDERRGVTEVQRMLTMMPEINRAAPQLYEVQSGGVSRTCQKLGSCCLYFKISDRQFCASCPIIPESERLERNRSWVAAQQSQT